MIDTDQERYIQEQIKEKQEIKAQEEKVKQLFTQYQKMVQENQQMHDKIQEQKEQVFKFSSIVTKQSHTGILSHKRLLVLHNGYLAYFSKVPTGFVEGKPEDIIEPVKSCVHVSNILKCYPQGANKFVVEFYAMNKQHKMRINFQNQSQMLQQSTLRPQLSIKPTKISKWVFTCPNDQLKKSWDAIINRAREPPQYMNQEEEYKKKKEEEEKMRQQVEKQKEQEQLLKQQQERRRMEKEEEKRRQEEERQFQSEQEQIERMIREEEEEKVRQAADEERQNLERERREVEKVRQLELEEKEKQLQGLLLQKQLEDDLIKKRKLEQLRREGRLEEINNQWMYKYLQALEVNCVQNIQGQSYDDLVIKGRFIYSVINDFKAKAMEISKQLINEQMVSEDAQNFQPIPESQYEEYFTAHPHIENNYFKVYYQENIAFKLAFSNMKESFVYDQQTQNSESVYVYYEEAIKHLVNEYKALNVLNNVVIQELTKDPLFSIRVPLACLIEYKGIVVLAQSIPCIDPHLNDSATLVKGYNNQDEYINKIDRQNQLKLITDLEKISNILNLKIHKINEIDEVELCSTVQIHKLLNNDYEDLQLCENVENIQEFAPQYLDFYFLIKCGNLFPLDVNIDSDMTHPHYKIRPEYLKQYKVPLNSDGFVTEENEEADELELSSATNVLRTSHIDKLVYYFENLDILPLDSNSLTQAFHENGINMRYLGEVYKVSTLPHIKEICQIEIVARICKKILRNNIYDSIKEKQKDANEANQKVDQQKFISSQSSSRLNSKAINSDIANFQKDLRNQFQVNTEHSINENLLDFLNLLLGSGQETEFFWSSIINKQAIHDFGCTINKEEIIQGGLLHALKHHCKIEFSFDQDTGIFEQINPFRKDQVSGFVPRIKLFDLRELEINKLGSQYQEQMKLGQNEQALQSINLKLNIISWLKTIEEQPPLIKQNQSTMSNYGEQQQQQQQQITFQEDQNLVFEEIKLLSDQSELLLYFFNYEDSTIKAVQALDLSPVAHVCQVKSLGTILRTKLMKSDNQKAMECFDRAVQIIEFHLGPFHPLHTILYSLLGCFYSQKKYYEEAIALYRSSLINSKKSLGDYHPHTAEVYKDMGLLYQKMSMYDESLVNFEMAYKIYVTCKQTDGQSFAEVCSHLTALTSNQNNKSQFNINSQYKQ